MIHDDKQLNSPIIIAFSLKPDFTPALSIECAKKFPRPEVVVMCFNIHSRAKRALLSDVLPKWRVSWDKHEVHLHSRTVCTPTVASSRNWSQNASPMALQCVFDQCCNHRFGPGGRKCTHGRAIMRTGTALSDEFGIHSWCARSAVPRGRCRLEKVPSYKTCMLHGLRSEAA